VLVTELCQGHTLYKFHDRSKDDLHLPATQRGGASEGRSAMLSLSHGGSTVRPWFLHPTALAMLGWSIQCESLGARAFEAETGWVREVSSFGLDQLYCDSALYPVQAWSAIHTLFPWPPSPMHCRSLYSRR